MTYSDGDNNGAITVSEIKQINHFYPFGANMEGNWNGSFPDVKNKYQFNGKELNTDFGLDWNDYGARFYDPQMIRFPMVDPLAEKRFQLNPYNYVQNNPILRIDPTGQSDTLPSGKTIYSKEGWAE